MNNIFHLRGHTIYVSDQAVFTLKYLVIHDEEGKKINISDLITATRRRQGCFFVFHDDGEPILG